MYDQFFQRLDTLKNIKTTRNLKIDIVLDIKVRQQYCLFKVTTMDEQYYCEVSQEMKRLKGQQQQTATEFNINIISWSYKLELSSECRQIYNLYFLTNSFEFYWIDWPKHKQHPMMEGLLLSFAKDLSE